MASSSRDMNAPVLTTLGIVTVLLLFVIVVATQAWFRHEYNQEYRRKVINRPDIQLEQLKSRQEANIRSGPVPLDRAKLMVIERYAKQPRNSGQGGGQNGGQRP